MNVTASSAGRGSPACMSALLRNRAEDPFIEIKPWQYGMAISISPVGRRVLGFSFLDAGNNLIEGETYDYRIVGYARRGDVEETFYGFHTVPPCALIRVFFLGPLCFEPAVEMFVESFPPAPPRSLRHVARKGLRIDHTVLSIRFQPVTRIVLELEPRFEGHDLEYEAWSSIALLSYQGTVPARPRVELDFPDPIGRLQLRGTGFLYGLWVSPLAPGVDPEEIVESDETIYGVRYDATPPPEPPPVLDTTNLQGPPKTGDPEDLVKEPLQDLGFHLSWLPPDTPPIWPPDLPARPLLEGAASFEIERRQVDTGERFQPIETDEQLGQPLIVGGSRSGRADPRPVYLQADLLALYPERETPQPPVPVWMELDDVLRSPGKPDGPPPGGCYQYRIYSVDLIGRRSLRPTEGPIIILEKHRPPPQPPGPVRPAPPPGEERVQPRGVTARVIQASDPYLTPDDAKKLEGGKGAKNAIVLEWGWTDVERSADPFAREFRIYFLSKPPDVITCNLTGQAAWNGSTYAMNATVDRAVSADQIAGQYVLAGTYLFRVSSHTSGPAGGIIQLQLEPSQVKPDRVPQPGSYVVMPAPTGEDFRPAKWDERAWVEPIAGALNYEYVFFDRLNADENTPRARAWVGVSAADDQTYVGDELPADKAWGGRPGNESSIAAVPVVAHYFGRPDFAGKPLWDVPTILLDELEGETISHTLDLPALLPLLPQQRFLVERISAADITALIGRTDDGRIRFELPPGETATAPAGTVHVFRYGEDPAGPGTDSDQMELLQAIATGEPARIANKFLMDILWRFRDDDLSRRWHAVPGTPAYPGSLPDTVPNKPERYIYRVRLLDAADHVSLGAALVPAVFRVPSPRTPGRPVLVKGFDLRLLPWGDGSGVPTSGSNLVVLGVDDNGLLHIRIFDAGGNLVTDTDEIKLPSTNAGPISTLKQRLPNLMLPHVLTDTEKADVIAEMTLIVDPTLGTPMGQEDQVQLTLKATDTFDLAGILLFYYSADATDGSSSVLEMKPELLRVPNRPDLYPDSGIRVRLADGRWTEHIFLPRASGVPDEPESGVLVFHGTISSGYDRLVAIWAATVTRDGVPSLLAGPRLTVTVPAPPTVPPLMVTAIPGRDEATWAPAQPGTNLTVEQSTDGATWRRVSPWLEAPAITAHDIVAPPAGPRWYRLRVRRPGRKTDVTGAPVQPQGGGAMP
jgi:hypothetical protein